MRQSQALPMFGALSEKTRLKIVRYLVACGEEGASAGKIGAKVRASSSRASFHLSALESAGLISSQRRSRSIIYRADFKALGGLISFLLNDCCDGHADVVACCNIGIRCC